MVRGTRVLAGAFAFVVIGALSAAPAAAQSGFSVTPWAGAYVPTRNHFSSVGSDISRDNSFIGGARLTFWGRSPIGLEFTGGFAPRRGATSGTRTTPTVSVARANLMLGLSPAASRVGIFLSSGAALIRRGHDVARESESVTDWGGVAGLGLRIPFSASVGLRLEGEDYFYGGNFSTGRQFQNDLVLSAGLALGW